MVRQRMKAVAAAVAGAASNIVGSKGRVVERRLLLVLGHDDQYYVLQPAKADDMVLSTHERATTKVRLLLSAKGKGPWPLFNSQNIVVQGSHHRVQSFVRDRIEYDVVCVVVCALPGQPEGVTPIDSLRQHGFTLTDIKRHEFYAEIRRLFRL